MYMGFLICLITVLIGFPQQCNLCVGKSSCVGNCISLALARLYFFLIILKSAMSFVNLIAGSFQFLQYIKGFLFDYYHYVYFILVLKKVALCKS